MTSQLQNQNELLKQLLQTLQREIQSKNHQQNIVMQELDNLYKENDKLSNKVSNLLRDNRGSLGIQNQMKFYIQNLETSCKNKDAQITFLQQRIQSIERQTEKERFMNMQKIRQPMHIPTHLMQNSIAIHTQTEKEDNQTASMPHANLVRQKSQEDKQVQRKLKNTINQLQSKIQNLHMNLTKKQLELKSKNELITDYEQAAEQREQTIQSLLTNVNNVNYYEEELEQKQKMIIAKNNQIQENDVRFLQIFGQLQEQWKQKLKQKQLQSEQKEMQLNSLITETQSKFNTLEEQYQIFRSERLKQAVQVRQAVIQKSISNDNSQSVDQLNFMIAEANMELRTLKEELETQQRKNMELQDTNQQLQQSVNSFMEQIERLRQQNVVQAGHISNLQEVLSKNQNSLNQMRYNLDKANQQIAQLNSKNVYKQLETAKILQQFNQKQEVNRPNQQQILKQMQNSYQKSVEAYKKLESQFQQLQLDVFQTQTERDKLKHQNNFKNQKILELSSENSLLQQKVEELMSILTELRRQSVSTANKVRQIEVVSVLEQDAKQLMNQNQFKESSKNHYNGKHQHSNSNASSQSSKNRFFAYDNNVNVIISPSQSKSDFVQQQQKQVKIEQKNNESNQQNKQKFKQLQIQNIDERMKVDGQMTEFDIQNLRNSFAAFGADIDFNRIAKNIGLPGAQTMQQGYEFDEREELIRSKTSITSLNKIQLQIPHIEEQMRSSFASIGSTNQYAQIVAYYQEKISQQQEKVLFLKNLNTQLQNDKNNLFAMVQELSKQVQNFKQNNFESIYQSSCLRQNGQKTIKRGGDSHQINNSMSQQIQNIQLIQKLTQQIEQFHAQVSQYDKKYQTLVQNCQQLQNQSEKLKEQNLQTYQVNKDLFDQNVTQSQKIKQTQEQLGKTKKLFEEYYQNHRSELGYLRSINLQLSEKNNSLALNYDKLRKQYTGIHQNLTFKEQQAHNLMVESSKLRVKLQSLQQQIIKLQNYIQFLQKQNLKISQIPISQGRPESHHDISHQQFTINNISQINMEDSFNNDKQRQITMLTNVCQKLKLELEQERRAVQQKNLIIMDLQDNMNNSQNNSNGQKMMLRKNIADMNAQILNLKKQLFKYNKDGDISGFIKNNFFGNKEKSLSQFQQREQKSKSNNSFHYSPRGENYQNLSFVTEKGKNTSNNSQSMREMNMGQQFIGRKLKNNYVGEQSKNKFSAMAQLFSNRYNTTYTPTSQSSKNKKIPSFSQSPLFTKNTFRNSGDAKIDFSPKEPTYGYEPRKRNIFNKNE